MPDKGREKYLVKKNNITIQINSLKNNNVKIKPIFTCDGKCIDCTNKFCFTI